MLFKIEILTNNTKANKTHLLTKIKALVTLIHLRVLKIFIADWEEISKTKEIQYLPQLHSFIANPLWSNSCKVGNNPKKKKFPSNKKAHLSTRFMLITKIGKPEILMFKVKYIPIQTH